MRYSKLKVSDISYVKLYQSVYSMLSKRMHQMRRKKKAELSNQGQKKQEKIRRVFKKKRMFQQ